MPQSTCALKDVILAAEHADDTGVGAHKILPFPKSIYFLLTHLNYQRFLCTSIICHLFFSILNNLKSLKCTSGFFVDKLLLKIIDFHPIAI